MISKVRVQNSSRGRCRPPPPPPRRPFPRPCGSAVPWIRVQSKLSLQVGRVHVIGKEKHVDEFHNRLNPRESGNVVRRLTRAHCYPSLPMWFRCGRKLNINPAFRFVSFGCRRRQRNFPRFHLVSSRMVEQRGPLDWLVSIALIAE